MHEVRYVIATLAFVLAAAALGSNADDQAQRSLHRVGPDLGRPIAESQAATGDLTISPDGQTLPPGRGSAIRGANLYAEKCMACHGERGVGGLSGAPRLTGGVGSLASNKPLKTMNSFWPFATGVFDYIRRSMPPTSPQSLPADDIYAITAYLLSIDGIVPANASLDAKSIVRVKMPNRSGFVSEGWE